MSDKQQSHKTIKILVFKNFSAVLDFQSLYPSIIIAYNLCFCTSLGKVSRLLESEEQPLMTLGALDYEQLDPKHIYEMLKRDEVHVVPTGCAFVKASVQKSLLAVFLNELLEARVMVKKSMKRYLDDEVTSRIYKIYKL